MADLSLMAGGDLVVTPAGDLAVVDGYQKGLQRVLRRLLTAAGNYIYHLNYGAGLQRRVGDTVNISDITALIRSQIFLEAAVAKDPEPQIQVTTGLNSLSVRIVYTDASTGLAQTLSFEVS